MITLKPRLNRGAVMGVAFFLLLACALYTPLSGLATLLLPAPLVLLFADKLDVRVWFLLAVAFVALALGGALLPAVVLLGAVGSFAYVLGKGLRDRTVKVAAVNATLVLIGFSILALILLRAAKVDIVTLTLAQVRVAVQQNPGLSQWAGSNSTALIAILKHEFTLYFPGFLVIVSAVVTLVNLAVARLVVRNRHGAESVLSEVRFPRIVVIVYATALLAQIFGLGARTPLIWGTVSNLEIVGDFLLSVQAISLIWWLVRGRRLAALWMVLAMIFWLMPLVGQLYVIAGLLDMLFDFRKRWRKP